MLHPTINNYFGANSLAQVVRNVAMDNGLARNAMLKKDDQVKIAIDYGYKKEWTTNILQEELPTETKINANPFKMNYSAFAKQKGWTA